MPSLWTSVAAVLSTRLITKQCSSKPMPFLTANSLCEKAVQQQKDTSSIITEFGKAPRPNLVGSSMGDVVKQLVFSPISNSPDPFLNSPYRSELTSPGFPARRLDESLADNAWGAAAIGAAAGAAAVGGGCCCCNASPGIAAWPA
jgi:hypothetical protein